MESVVKGIDNIIVYIDDLLVHSDTHDSYLGLRLTDKGILPGSDKLKAIARAKPCQDTRCASSWASATFSGITSGISPRSRDC